MKPAVLMMFRDEADILGKCLDHWYNLGVLDFYLCDNGSIDESLKISHEFSARRWRARVSIIQDTATDWPGRRIVNEMKNRALADGCNWIFPADADEFLQMPYGLGNIYTWLMDYPQETSWGEIKYRNMMPDGTANWQEPQRKVFGWLTEEMTISMGNHLIEGVAATIDDVGAHYHHYSLRSYPQFKRKMENYMIAFSKNGFPDHHHAESFKIWQVEGEAYLQRKWTELTGMPCE